jgi:hypothetical protein
LILRQDSARALLLALDSNVLGGMRSARTDAPSIFFVVCAFAAYLRGRRYVAITLVCGMRRVAWRCDALPRQRVLGGHRSCLPGS